MFRRKVRRALYATSSFALLSGFLFFNSMSVRPEVISSAIIYCRPSLIAFFPQIISHSSEGISSFAIPLILFAVLTFQIICVY